MKHKYFLTLAAFILGISFSSCASVDEKNRETVSMPNIKIDDGKHGNEVSFSDSEIENKGGSVPTFGEGKKEITQTIRDGSQITSMQDGYGNTVQTRYFFNHPNLTSLTVKTFADGQKEGIVFGHNGEHKKLSSDVLDKALNAAGNDIAQTVGITTTKRESSSRPTIVRNMPQTQTYPTIPDPRIQPVNPQSQEINNENQTETTETTNNQTVKQNSPVAQNKKNNESEN